MNDKVELQNRLDHIEEVCQVYLETKEFPKNIVMKHVIGIAKGENREK